MARYRVRTAYRTAYPDPIRFTAGTLLTLGRIDDEWPAFQWARAPDGREGWVPRSLLDPIGDGRAAARDDYSARELAVEVGDELVAERENGGWIWARDARGDTGWVPLRHLEPA